MAEVIESKTVRMPTLEEKQDLYSYAIFESGPILDDEELSDLHALIGRTFVAVCDDFMTDGPGISGEVMLVMWPSGEVNTFTWENGHLLCEDDRDKEEVE